jgi:EmrB/QacA subfamily drug resistance transporter
VMLGMAIENNTSQNQVGGEAREMSKNELSSPLLPDAPSRRGIILATCCLSLFVIFMDVTIVNVALPAIRASFHATTATLQWIIDGYTIVIAAFLLLAGSMADKFGRRRVFQCGMIVFCIGSALCGLAPSAEWLVAFRAIQALGGSMLNPVAMSIITNTFLAPRERARALGVWSAVAGIGMAAGPLVGGILTQWLSWRANFWVNLPIGAVAVVSAQIFIPESKSAKKRPLDAAGQALVILLLTSLIGGIIEGPSLGWRSHFELGLLAIAALAFAGFVCVESRQRFPLIDLQLFRVVPFTSAAIVAIISSAGFGALLFSVSLIFQESYGYPAAQSGLYILPMAAGTVLCAPISARMVGKWGARPSLIFSGSFIALSGLMLTRIGGTSSIAYFVISYTVFGVGFGMVNTPITYTAVNGLPRDRAGVAAAVASASRQIGIAFGVALAGVISGSKSEVAHRVGRHFIDRIYPLWWLIAGVGFLVVVLAAVATSAWGLATSRHAAHLFAEDSGD